MDTAHCAISSSTIRARWRWPTRTLAINRARLDEIPEADLPVTIGELGSHCRGAVFENGERLVTSALEQAIDGAGRALPGFMFGRYDVRAESEGALKDGRFTILELNGVHV